MTIETLLNRFENCEQARVHIDYCDVDELYTVIVSLNGAEFLKTENEFIDSAIAELIRDVDHLAELETTDSERGDD